MACVACSVHAYIAVFHERAYETFKEEKQVYFYIRAYVYIVRISKAFQILADRHKSGFLPLHSPKYKVIMQVFSQEKR